MQTLNGIRFLPVARVDGMQFGLDARWLGVQGLGLILLLTLVSPAGPLSTESSLPLWLRVLICFSTVAGLALTSLGHELGHVIAGRLAGLTVRAVVLAPGGAMTIRARCDHAHLNFRTAMAGPLANAVLGTLALWLAVVVAAESPLQAILAQLAALQLITAIANLLPYGPLDGQRIVAAWRAL